MVSILEKTTGLVAFVRTVDAGSFSAASRLIGSSQSAVSKSVARLEHRLGVRLIQRSTRTLSLTTEGQAYYERVAPLLRAIDDAEDLVQAASEAKGLLRVSAPQEFGRMLIASWAPEFLARHPGVKLELNVTDRNVDIIRAGRPALDPGGVDGLSRATGAPANHRGPAIAFLLALFDGR